MLPESASVARKEATILVTISLSSTVAALGGFTNMGELSLISMMVTYRGAIDMRSVLVVPLSAEREESKGDGAGIALKVHVQERVKAVRNAI